MNNDFWAITTYFNPMGWESRQRNYQLFRQALSVPLLTVEWSQDGNFQLSNDDASALIQVSGGDLIWQRERLVNIGLAHLPKDCKYVAWLDGDILFADHSWPALAREKLQSCNVIQLFSWVNHLIPGTNDLAGDLSGLRRDPSIFHAMSSFENRDAFIARMLRRIEFENSSNPLDWEAPELMDPPLASGFAWAAQRSWLEKIGGLPDASAVGGADKVWFYAFTGYLEEFMNANKQFGGMQFSQRLHNWYQAVIVSSPVASALDLEIYHLYHGSLANRNYKKRHIQLSLTGFDLDQHLIDRLGCAWAYDASCPLAARQYFNEYFSERQEDS